MMMWRRAGMVAGMVFVAGSIATHVEAKSKVIKNVARYQCDVEGTKMGLGKKSFLIEYLKDDTRNIAIIPLADKKSTTLSRVSSTAGAKYVSSDFTWLVPGDSAPTLTSERMAGQPSVPCKQLFWTYPGEGFYPGYYPEHPLR